MSFGGGGSGAAGITAHVHSNAAGEGGSLDDTTLINDSSLFTTVIALG